MMKRLIAETMIWYVWKFWKDLNFAHVLFHYSYVRFLFFIKHDFPGMNRLNGKLVSYTFGHF